MVDPITLSVLLAALVASATGRAGEEATEGAISVLKRLASRLRRQFSEEAPDADALTALDDVEEVPDSPKRVQALTGHIQRHLEASPTFRTEMQALADEAERGGINPGPVIATIWGNNNDQLINTTNSSINITRGAS